jgi:hypothetical protein
MVAIMAWSFIDKCQKHSGCDAMMRLKACVALIDFGRLSARPAQGN